MPNVYQFGVRARAKGFEGRTLWDTKITWTVPVNDRTFAAFDVTHTPLPARKPAPMRGPAPRSRRPRPRRAGHGGKDPGRRDDDRGLPPELSAYTTFAIEDYVTQVGQGPVESRGREEFGHTDAKVVLLRRLWLREVDALVEGRPLTDWKISRSPCRS